MTEITPEEITELLLNELQKNSDQRLTNAQLTQITGLSERTLRRRKAALRKAPAATATLTSATPTPEIPPNAIQTRGKVSRYTPGVGWDSAEYTVEPDPEQILTLEQVTTPLTANPGPLQTQNSNLIQSSYVIALSDLQAGKTDELGGTEQLSKRLASVFSQIEAHLTTNHYQEIILVDTGDILEGFSNTVAQQQTNDLSLTDQIRYAQRVVVEAIRRFVPFAPNFVYISVPSNHCAVRTGAGSKNRSNAPNDDWGLLISENIEQSLKITPGYEHITFVRPSKWEEAVTYASLPSQTTLAVVHGHQFGPGKAKEYLAKMVLGRRSNLQNADVLLFGHHHSFTLSLAGAGQHVIGAPTIDNGSSWYSNNSGESSPASMLTFVLEKGTSSTWTILCP